MERKPRSYRFSENIVLEIQELTTILGTSETEAVARAVHFYLTFLRNEEDVLKQRSVVPLAEYQSLQERLQNQISQLIYRTGILEGANAEKDQTIQNLKETINKLLETKQQKQDKEKGFWKIFWWAIRKDE